MNRDEKSLKGMKILLSFLVLMIGILSFSVAIKDDSFALWLLGLIVMYFNHMWTLIIGSQMCK